MRSDDGFTIFLVSFAICIIIGMGVIINVGSKNNDIEDMIYKETSLTLDDMKYIDEGKVFKYNNRYYLRTKSGYVIELQQSTAYEKYEK